MSLEHHQLKDVPPLPLLTFVPSSSEEPLVVKDAIYTEFNDSKDNYGPPLIISCDAFKSHIQITKDVQPPKDFAEALIALHFGQSNCSLSMSDISNFYCFLSTRFERFAYSLQSFSCLSRNDQTALLSFNTPLYFQYHLCKYVKTYSGYDQICGLLNVSSSYFYEQTLPTLTNIDSKEYILTVSLNYFVSICLLFSDKTQVNIYENLAEGLEEITLFPDAVHYIAEAILFYFKPNSYNNLEDPGLVLKYYEKAIYKLQRGLESFYNSKTFSKVYKRYKLQNIENICNLQLEFLPRTKTFYNECITTLNKLAHFYSQHGNIRSHPSQYAFNSKRIEPSDQEKYLLTSQILSKDFNEPFRNIDLGSNLVDILFNESIETTGSLLDLFHKRILLVMEKCMDFNELKEEDQYRLWKANGIIAIGILSLYLEIEIDILQRLKILLGEGEMHVFRDWDCIPTKEISIFTKSPYLSKLKKMIPHNQDIVKLIILCILFQGNESLSSKYTYYEDLLKDKLRSNKKSSRIVCEDSISKLLKSSEIQRQIMNLTMQKIRDE